MKRKMLDFSLSEKVRNGEIQRRTKETKVLTMLTDLKWRLANHLTRHAHITNHKLMRTDKQKYGKTPEKMAIRNDKFSGKNWIQTAFNKESIMYVKETYIKE